ncbi:hypothetical protein SUGI_1516740 [Cryptomeria japonica]|uniref:Uncharacterized protein n=1 Tax=Cryptomeria japonica TaxID=3369 RepID=A0AAD3NW84_CRYJA|nr:hypothetical protein SUGI_1516740 [Cryptomeria japonica]
MLNPDAVGWPSKCKWTLKDHNNQSSSTSTPTNNDYPHHHIENEFKLNRTTKIHNSILDCVGQTPLVRLNNLAKSYGIKCDLLAECEYLSPEW